MIEKHFKAAKAKIVLLFLLLTFCMTGYAQNISREFVSAKEAITWAQINKAEAAGITHIAITGNNDQADLFRLKTLNTNSQNGLFKALESIELTAQTDTLPNSCFYQHYQGAEWLKSFSAPHITVLGSWAFRFCTNLSEVNLPALTSIGAYAFYNSGITNIQLPAALVDVDENPFLACKKLTGIHVEAGNEHFFVENGILYNADKTLLISYPSGKTEESFTSPGMLAYIGSNALGICNTLSAIEFPAATHIGNWAFEYCTGLKTVKFNAPGSVRFEADVFFGVATTDVNLYLNKEGEEYKNEVNENVWKEYTWKMISDEQNAEIQEAGDLLTSITLYPNPVRDILRMKSTGTIDEITIFDLNSNIVLKTTNADNGINMTALPNGIYVVKITTESGIKTEQIVKATF